MTSTRTSKRKRRPYAARVPAQQRRTELLDAALHLIATHGHTAATMDTVAEQAGVTKPVVYGQFSNRAQLLTELLHREQQQALHQLLEVFPDDLGGRLDTDPGQALERALGQFLRAVRETPDRWHCIVMPMPDMPPAFHTARQHARAVTLQRTATLARELLRTLDAPPELDPEIVAHTVVTMCEMAARLTLTDPDHYHPEQFVAALHAAIGLTQGPR